MMEGEQMVILRLSPGLANQMYEYAAGYALSKELKQELVLDIAECVNSPFGYLLDNFNISNHRKIVYNQKNNICESHENYGSALSLFPNIIVLVENIEQRKLYPDNDNVIVYENIGMSNELKKYSDIYMCGYFFNREKYYKKYWNELINLFTLKNENESVKQFRKMIEGKVSIGVHIRRGDMLLADWAIKLEDDYYKAAIGCYRKMYKDSVFCIFSDDIEYAKTLLGKSEDIHYMHFTGYDDASVNELFCLKICNHRVLSNSSTFGRIADDLNYGKDRHVIYRDTEDKTKGITFDEKKDNREILLNTDDINFFSSMFHTSDIFDDFLPEEDDEEKYEKFIYLVNEKRYHEALQLSYNIHFRNREKDEYIIKLVECLFAIRAYEECAVELAYLANKGLQRLSDIRLKYKEEYIFNLSKSLKANRKRQFIIVAREKANPASRINGVIAWAMTLAHLGYKTTVIYDPSSDSGKYYLENNHLFNCRGIDLGCEHFEKRKILERGVIDFYNQLPEEEIVVVSRDSSFMVRERCEKKIFFITTDLSDIHDTEVGTIISNNDNLNKEEELSDIVVTFDKEKKEDRKYIYCKKIINYDDYYFFDESWEYGYNQRTNINNINVISRICERLNEMK